MCADRLVAKAETILTGTARNEHGHGDQGTPKASDSPKVGNVGALSMRLEGAGRMTTE